jgi:hypothetical protein
VHVRAGKAGWVGGDEDPDFRNALAVTVWNRGDAPVTIERWGFEYCNRWRLPTLPWSAQATGIGMYSVERRKGEVPQTLEPGGTSSTFATPLAEVRRYVQEPMRLRAYVIVGHRPRHVRSWRLAGRLAARGAS